MPHKKRKGERPDGLIQRSFQIGYKADGSPDRKYFYGHTAKEAEEKRDEFKRRFKAGSTYSPNITVREWVEIFKGTYRKNVNEAYLAIDDVPYGRLIDEIGDMRMVDVRESHLQLALNKVSGMSFSTVDKYCQAIRRVFLRAVKNKVIEDNPASDLVMPPYIRGAHRALERWEVEFILEHWSSKSTGAGLFVLVMLLCGLRRGEAMALDWSSVDLKARTLEVNQVAVVHKNAVTIEKRAKSEAGLRTLPICKALYLALSTVPPERRTGFVCLSTTGRQLTGGTAASSIQQFCAVMTRILNGEPEENPVRLSRKEEEARQAFHASEDYRVFSFTAHDLRHTFATALYDAGVPVKAAQYFLGHADVRMTMDLYTHLSKERDTASRKQMVEHFDAWLDDRIKNAPALPEPVRMKKTIIKIRPPESLPWDDVDSE